LGLGHFHLAEHRAGDQHRRHAADLVADMFPGPALLALDAEQFLGKFGSCHGRPPVVRRGIACPETEQMACQLAVGTTPN
jgi:hypothetical protein